MTATAEGAFRIIDKASAPLKDIKHNATDVQGSMVKTGASADKAGRDLEKMATKGSAAMKGMADEGQRQVRKLTNALRRFEHERATAKLDVDIASAEAKIRLVKQELRTVTTAQARKELDLMGLTVKDLTNSLSGVGGGGGGPPGVGAAAAGGGGLRGSLLGVTGGLGFMTIAMIAAAPAVVALAGAVSALIGSLGAAVGGAGALGVGVLGAAAVGVAGILAVAIPATKAIKEAKDTQDKYNEAVKQYGSASAQAIQAHRRMEQAFKKAPGVQSLLQNVQVLGQRFKRATAPGQADFIGVLNEGIQFAADNMKTFAGVANQAMGAARSAVETFFAVWRTPEARGIMRTMGETFSRALAPAGRALANLSLFFGRVSRAASPMVVRMFESIERWTANLARSAGNAGRVQQIIGGLVDQAKSWVRFFGAAIRLAGTFFGAGATQGQSMLERVTDQLNVWSDWLESHPAQVQDFFERTIDAAGKLADAIGQIVSVLGQVSDALVPVVGAFAGMVGSAGDAGLLGPLAAYGGFRVLTRGRRGGGAGGGAKGGGGLFLGGGGAVRGAATGVGSRYQTFAMQRGLGDTRAGALRTALGRGARFSVGGAARGLAGGLARKVGPLALAFGAYDFLTSEGNVGNRLLGAANGALFGVPNMLGARWGQGPAAQMPGNQRAARFLGTGNRSTAGIAGHIARLEDLMGATRSERNTVSGPGGTFTRTTVHPVLSGDAKREVQAEIDALRPILKTQITIEQTNKAQRAFDDLLNAFEIRWSRRGSKIATTGLIGGINRQLALLKPEGKTKLLEATAAWTDQLESGSAKQRRVARRLKDYIVNQYEEMGKRISIVNGRILTGSQSEWAGIRSAMSSEAERALEEVTKSFTDIQREAIGSLMAMGFSRGEARKLVRGLEAGGSRGGLATSVIGAPGASRQRNRVSGIPAQAARALGGRIPGVGSVDSIGIGGAHAAPGELIVNRHTENRADRRLGFPGALAMMVNGERTPHSMTRFATGGRYGGVTPGMADLISRLDSAGFQHGSTTGGQHASGSYHYRGMAVDYGSATNNLERLWRVVWPMRGRFAELFGPHGLFHNGNAFQDPGLQSQHMDHIHMALAGAAGALGNVGALGGGGINLRRRRTRRRGVPGAMSQRGLDAMVLGQEQAVNRILGAGGTGAVGAGVSGTNVEMARQMMMQMGWGANEWPALKSLWTQESGFSETARNPSSGAYGIPQSLPASKMGPAAQGSGAGAARAQIGWGLRYIRGRYGSPSAAWAHEQAHNWYSFGGRTPGIQWGGWHGNGGSFTAHRPTIIGVGERGAERVTVRPKSGGPGGGRHRPILVHIEAIHYNGEGDIANVIEKEFLKVAKSLDDGPDDGEDELG